jgi:hypothetical protein
MKARPVIPEGAGLSPEEDARFEEIAARELERLGLASLDRAVAFWRWLPKAHPQTRRRLLVQCLEASARTNAPVPKRLIPFFEVELKTSRAPRSRVHKQDKMRKAARYKVRHPGSSFSEIADAIGSPGKKTTVASYFDRPDFWKFCADEKLLLDLGRQYEVLADYEKRFGPLDYNGTDACDYDDGTALCCLVPEMMAALDGKRGALDRSSIESAKKAYAKTLQPDSLKKELLAVHQ